MNCADMILDSVGVANPDEVNLSDMIVSGVNFPKFTSLVQHDIRPLLLSLLCNADDSRVVYMDA